MPRHRWTVVSSKGQVVLPRETRKEAGIAEGNILSVTAVKKGTLFLKKLPKGGPTQKDIETLKGLEKAWEDIEKGRYTVMTLEQHNKWLKKLIKSKKRKR